MAVVVPADTAIRRRVLEASGRIRRVKALDRLATGFITTGGVFIIVAVSFIFVFLVGETLPLVRPASGQALGTLNLAAAPPLAPAPGGEAGPAAPATSLATAGIPAKPLVIGIDEYQMYFYEVLGDGRTA